MDQTRRIASHAARLLGALATTAPVEPASATLLATQVADALGVTRPAGESTLHSADNVPLRILLEERRLLGTEASADAIDRALREGSLIIAARGMSGTPVAGRPDCLAMLLDSRVEGAPLCVFTHDLALRRYAGAAPVSAWVTAAAQVWQFAVHVLRRPAIIDPGSNTELPIDGARLRRLAGG